MMSTQVQEKNIVRIFAKIISFLFTLSFIITSALPIKANSEIPNISVVQINKNTFSVTGPDGSVSTIHEYNVGMENQWYEVVTAKGIYYTIKESDNKIIISDGQSTESFDLYNPTSISYEPSACAGIPWEGSWGTITQSNGSRSVTIGDYGMILGVLAAIAKVSVAHSVIVTVATWMAGKLVKEAYFHYKQQTRIWHGWVESRNVTTYYTSSTYKTLVPGSSTVYSSPVKLHTVT